MGVYLLFDSKKTIDKKFIDLYEFLGIPPNSPPNLIYLAIKKMELAKQKLEQNTDFRSKLDKYIYLASNYLLTTADKRKSYEITWKQYYSNISSKKQESNFKTKKDSLRILKNLIELRLIVEKEKDKHLSAFENFIYFFVNNLEKKCSYLFLSTRQNTQLSPEGDYVFFENKQFHLKTCGKLKLMVTNDVMGKLIFIDKREDIIPLHIGDRISFSNKSELILHTLCPPSIIEKFKNKEIKTSLFIHLQRENVTIKLDTSKIYIFGRNTTVINCSRLDEHIYCFVNIGRRDYSISQQNFQIFCHQGIWYIQDLGSRFGTTLDINNYFRLETIVGGEIIHLQAGKIRLGFNKNYIIEVSEEEKSSQKNIFYTNIPYFSNRITIYNLPLV